MIRAIENVLTFFIVIVLIILLLNSLGPFIANSIQPASERLSDILQNTWIGVQHIAPGSPGESHPRAPKDPDVNLSIHPAPAVQLSDRVPQ